MSVDVAVLPEGVRTHVADAVEAGGGRLVGPDEARMLVWTDPHDADALVGLLADHPGIEVVQLLWAGVEAFAERGLFEDGRTWACGKGVYAEPVAEHALAMTLALLRGLPARIRSASWGPQWGTSLIGAGVVVVGGGGIAESFLALLAPFRCDVTVVRRTPTPVVGATVVTPDRLHEVLAGADVVVLAVALTPETTGMIDAAALRTMPDHAVVVNVARGEHVVTPDLVAALEADTLGGYGTDVTDPEPLPDGHPLWALQGRGNVVITPHTANTEEMAVPLVSDRIRTNVRRLAAGEPLVGLVDPEAGY